MNKKLIFASVLALTIFFGKAQNSSTENSTGIIKIVTVDEDGKKTEVVQSIEDMDEESMTMLTQQLIELDVNNIDLEGVSIMSTSGDNIEIDVESDGHKYIVHKSVKHEGPFLGIHLAQHDDGILITHIVEGAGAEAAGLNKGDVITRFNSNAIASHEDLKLAMQELEVGEKVRIEYLREGKAKKASAVLGEYPEKDFERKVIWINHGEEIEFTDGTNFHQVDLKELSTKPFLGITPVEKAKDITGVMIYEVIEGTSAETLGLQTGDVVYDLNTTSISNFNDLVDVLKAMHPKDPITISFKRDGIKKTVTGNLGSKADAHNTMKFKMKEFHFDSDEIHDIDYVVIGISDKELAMLSDKTGTKLETASKLNNADINLYPNPSQGKFKIEFNTEVKKPLDVKIFDTAGKEVFSESIPDFNGSYKKEIDLNENSDASYFLVILQDGKAMTEKIIVQ